MLRVVSGVSLIAERGQVTALLGANGAGKTTTIECAQGLQARSGGTISLLGQDPGRSGAELRSRVGVMLQDGGLPPSARPIPLLRHIAGMYARPRSVDELVERLGIDTFARTSVRRLSGGQKQRLADYVYIIDGGRNVAEGTVAQLLQRAPAVESGEHIRTLLFEAEAGLNLAGILPETITINETRAGSYVANGPLTPQDLAALATWWAVHGVMPSSLSLAARSLEDVFLDVSGKDIR
jgi:ABC-2 type transport system ATP-binding protein